MIDRLFTATLTFCLLIGGTLAIGSAMLGTDQRVAAPKAASAPVRTVQLERVVIVGKRLAPTADVAQTEAVDSTAPRVQ
jgi:hypothetical protein